MSLPVIAGIELGGTKCVVLRGTGPDAIAEQRRIATRDPDATLAEIEQVLDGWGDSFAAIGIASFGPLDLDPASAAFGSISATTKPGWSGTDLVRRLEARYGRPVAIQTDVNGAAMAEARWGAAQGLTDHCYITIGTGVGVGTIVAGRPVQGVAHGEAGHMRVTRAAGDDFAGWCPFHGDCMEGLISGPALAKRFGMPGDQLPHDAPGWELFVHDLAQLLHNLVVTLAPQRIALGGGVIAQRPGLFPAIRSALARNIGGYGSMAAYVETLDERVGPPGLGDQAGPLGAIAMGLGAA
jgi:fructokinase